jgi:peptide/nickel transport system substrate-binding protein
VRHVRSSTSLLTLLVGLSLVAAACGGGGGSKSTTGGATGKKGGSIVLGAEQWPDCINPVTQCQNASWLHWTVAGYVLPRLMEIDPKGNFVGSPLLTETPTTSNGGIKQNPFTITYHLNPKAVWDDKTPITSADVAYSFQAYLKTTGSLSTTGYDKITSVDTPDPQTAIAHFSSPYADWWDLLGGNQQYVLKKAAFNGNVDLKDAFQSSYPFSGGPFKLQSWTKDQAVLVRNANYWDSARIPLLDQVTFVPRTDQDSEINALLSGEVQAIYPQPSPQFSKRLAVAGVKFRVDAGTTFEGLWFNLQKAPLNDKAVRQAIAYGIDRQAVVDALIKPDAPSTTVLNCAGWVPGTGKWCDNTQYSKYTYDPAKAKQILQSDGWTLGADGIFAKAGKRLSLAFATTSGNKGREDTQALLKDKAKAAGIEMTIDNSPRTVLFQDRLPKLNYVMAEYAQTASPDPSITAILAGDQIPKAPDYSGQNTDAWNNAQATALMHQSDQTVDIAKREDLIHQIGAIEADDLPWIPLYQKPLITAWRSDKIAGPVGDYNTSSYSGFGNIWAWSLK